MNIDVHKIKHGDRDAFEVVFKTYYAHIERFVRHYVIHSSDSQDIAQGVFVNLWLKREILNPEKDIKSFLFLMAKNAALDHLRKVKVRDRYREQNETGISTDVRIEMLDHFDSDRLGDAIERAMKLLPEKDRDIFIRSHISQMTYKQIAVALNISAKTVEKRVYIVRKFLRKELAEDYYLLLIIGFGSILE